MKNFTPVCIKSSVEPFINSSFRKSIIKLDKKFLRTLPLSLSSSFSFSSPTDDDCDNFFRFRFPWINFSKVSLASLPLLILLLLLLICWRFVSLFIAIVDIVFLRLAATKKWKKKSYGHKILHPTIYNENIYLLMIFVSQQYGRWSI